ncbi:MAG: hypothetical protein WA962_00930 [Ornithinimicrobium sp.]
MNVSNVQYTAGLGGFLVLFGLGLVLWFLGRDLTRRLRRMRQREALRQQAVAPAAPPEVGRPNRASASEPSGSTGPAEHTAGSDSGEQDGLTPPRE